MTSATDPAAAVTMAGRPPSTDMVSASTTEETRLTVGSTPAITENEITSGTRASVVTTPASDSRVSWRGSRSTLHTVARWDARAGGRRICVMQGTPRTGGRACGRGPPGSVGGDGVLGVHDPVGVTLLGEEALPVGGELGVHGVAGDDGVEARRHPVVLGAEQPAQPLGLLLPGAEGAGDLDGHLRGRQVDGEVRDLADHEQVDLAGAERLVELLALADRGVALDQRRPEALRELVQLVDVLPDHQGRQAAVLRHEVDDD